MTKYERNAENELDNMIKHAYGKRNQYMVDVARDIIKLLAERKIMIFETDDVFGYVKSIISTISISEVLSNPQESANNKGE